MGRLRMDKTGAAMSALVAVFMSLSPLLIALPSQGQTVQSSRFRNDTGPMFGAKEFHDQCPDIVSNFSVNYSSDPTEQNETANMFCKCLRTSNNPTVVNDAYYSRNGGGTNFTALIHALLPLSNSGQFQAGEQLKWALYLALFHLNSYVTDDIRISTWLWATDCSDLKTTRTIADMFLTNRGAGVLGPACGNPAILINGFASYFSMADVGYSVETDRLGSRDEFSSFYRMSSSAAVYSRAFLPVMERLGWSRVSIIVENNPSFQELLDDFQKQTAIRRPTVELKALESISNNETTGFNVQTLWNNILRAKTRIVIIMMYEVLAQRVLCTGYHNSVSSSCCDGRTQLVFVVPGWYAEGWHRVPVNAKIRNEWYNCTAEQMNSMVAHSFSISQQFYRPNEAEEINLAGDYNMSVARWKELNQLAARYCYDPDAPSRVPTLYDGVIHDSLVLYYKAYQELQRSLLRSNNTYKTLDNRLNVMQGQGLLAVRWALIKLMGSVKFQGLSGDVYFNKLNHSFVSNVFEAQEQINISMRNGLLEAFEVDPLASDPNRPVKGTVRQRSQNGTERLIATLYPNGSISEFRDDDLTWGACCGSAVPSDTIPDDVDCHYVSSSLAQQLGTCDRALAFVICMVVGLCLVLLAIIAILWKRWYRKKLAQARAEGVREQSKKDDELYDKVLALSAWEIPRNRVIINRRLGEGAFGEVFGGELIVSKGDSQSSTGIEQCAGVAIKTLHQDATLEDKKSFLEEGELMTRFDHDNIVKLLGFCTLDEPFYVIMELMMHGDLKAYLLSYRYLSGTGDSNELNASRLTHMVRQVASGMAYLACENFVHRDIAARNCMVTVNYTVKLGDFGMARAMYTQDYYRVKQAAPFPVRWMASESLFDGCFTLMSDMWSFGVVAWEVITFGEMPFPGMNNAEVVEAVRDGQTPEIPRQCPQQLCSFIRSCWTQNADARLKAEAAVNLLLEKPTLIVPCVEKPRDRRNAAPEDLPRERDRGRSVRHRPIQSSFAADRRLDEGTDIRLFQSLENLSRSTSPDESSTSGRYVLANPSPSSPLQLNASSALYRNVPEATGQHSQVSSYENDIF